MKIPRWLLYRRVLIRHNGKYYTRNYVRFFYLRKMIEFITTFFGRILYEIEYFIRIKQGYYSPVGGWLENGEWVNATVQDGWQFVHRETKVIKKVIFEKYLRIK